MSGSSGDTEGLDRYQTKRDFAVTSEPRGAIPSGTASSDHSFVIQEHHASSLHWDLRLERDGVLVSWAIPKGLPPDPRVNHLAVHTEDHPMEYLEFHGDIPTGEYGAGSMTIWDRGTYEPHKWSEREVIVTLHGERAQGRHALFRTRGDQWMIHRMDPAQDPTRELLPEPFAPPPVVAADAVPDGDGWCYEPAMAGVRLNVAVEGGRVAWAIDDNGNDVAGAFPELARMAAAQGVTQMVVEAELAVMGPDGRPDPALVQARVDGGANRAHVRRLAERNPAAVVVSDLRWFEGHDLTPLPFRQRRQALEELEVRGPAWTTAAIHDDGQELLHAAAEQGLAGVRARRDGERLLIASPGVGGPAASN